jgi:isopentenyl-diphosphate delta-isomerase
MGSDELVWAVDENDRPVGEVWRSEAHATVAYHCAVHVLLFDGDGRLMLQKRSRTKTRISPILRSRWEAI